MRPIIAICQCLEEGSGRSDEESRESKAASSDAQDRF